MRITIIKATNLHVVFPTPPLPPTKIHFNEDFSTTFLKSDFSFEKSQTWEVEAMTEIRLKVV